MITPYVVLVELNDDEDVTRESCYYGPFEDESAASAFAAKAEQMEPDDPWLCYEASVKPLRTPDL